MRTRTLAIAALVLWLLTLAGAAALFIRGLTTPAADGRTAIALGGAERDLVLVEMRTMLDSIRGVTVGLADADPKQVAAAARASGSAMTTGVPPTLMAKLPLAFKQQGMAVHGGFDEIAVAAEQGEPVDLLLVRLGQQLGRCVACHAAYRLGGAAADGR
jgi:hypothetical protein